MGGTVREIDEMASTGGIAKSYELRVGQMVGEYRIEGELGAGGMGKVYAATHPVIAKRAAIKVLHPELSVNTEAVERFVQEARSVNQIGHPNIVDIFAFGALPDGRSYFVMERLCGESLRDRLRKGVPPIIETLQILDTIAVALEAAHEKGIVHRDLKPDNVFLVETKGKEPQVKLLDFGIAKLLAHDDLRAEHTRTGNLLGTPAYISPEQARGYAVDHRTDVYALGALTYEMLTAWLPFPSDNAAEMIAKHLYEPAPHASERNPQVPAEIDHLIIAMLSKDPGERPPLEEVRQHLRLFSNQLLIAGPTGALAPMRTTSELGVRAQMQHTLAPHTAMTHPTPKRSKAALFIVGGLLATGLSVGVFVARTNGGGTSNGSATTGDSTKPGVATEPADATSPTDTVTNPTKPIDFTKPADPTDSTKRDSTPLTGSTKPTRAVPTNKPGDKTLPRKRPGTGGTKTGTTGGATLVDDPDAPM